MRFPIRPLRGAWPSVVESRLSRFFWQDPQVLLQEDPDAAAFRAAMSAIHVGETIKITGSDRHPSADALLLENVELEGVSIVDIGASDGSTSVDLVRRLPPHFGSFVIADLYLTITVATLRRHIVFFDPHQSAILMRSRRSLCWPSRSKVVRCLYWPLLRRAREMPRTPVLLLNPQARELVRSDARVSYREHDVFTPWTDEAPQVIKVANLLRRLYFSDDDIKRALETLLAGLTDKGHLLVVDNPRIDGIQTRGGLYRKDRDHFVLVAQTQHSPEIADLIANVGAAVA